MASMYEKGGRFYGSFPEFKPHNEGRRSEALIPSGERYATRDRQLATVLFYRRLSELVDLRARIGGTEAGAPEQAKTVNHLLDEFIASRSRLDSSRWCVMHQRHRDIIVEFFGKATLTEVNAGRVEDFVLWLQSAANKMNGNAFAESTQRKVVNFLRAALNHAVRRAYISANPAYSVDPQLMPRERAERETRFYSVEEAGLILSALQRMPGGERPADWPARASDFLFEQVAFALLTGARKNEIAAQRWEWVNWNIGLVQILKSKGKGRDRDRVALRSVVLWPQLREILRSFWSRVGAPEAGLMFPKQRPPVHPRKHFSAIERGGMAGTSIEIVLRLRGLVTWGTNGEGMLFMGRPGYQLGWREFRVTYCATRLQVAEPVEGRPGQWVATQRRTVEVEMGHSGPTMIETIYGRVSAGPQRRLTAVEYPMIRLELSADGTPAPMCLVNDPAPVGTASAPRFGWRPAGLPGGDRGSDDSIEG